MIDVSEAASGDAVAPPSARATPSSRLSATRGRALFALKLVVSAALIVWIVLRADLAGVVGALREVEARWLVLAWLLQFVGVYIMAVRWQLLLGARMVRPGLVYLLGSTLAAAFFRQFLPSTIGGDAVRGYDAWRAGADAKTALMSLVVDRLLGLVVLGGFALAAIFWMHELTDALPDLTIWAAGGLVVLLLGLVVLAVPTRVLPRQPKVWIEWCPARVRAIFDALGLYRGHTTVLMHALGLSLLLQVNVVLFYWLISQSLGLGIEFMSFFAITPIAIFVMMVPITINGIGLREMIFVFLLGLWDIPEAQALALAWIEFGMFLSLGILGGIVYALRRH